MLSIRSLLLSFGMVLGVQLAVPPLAVAAELSEIQARGHLVVAVNEHRRPLAFRNEAGELVGLEIDIARRLATEILGDPNAVVFQTVPNRDRLAVVLADRADVAIAGLTTTPTRRRIVSFSVPYYLDGAAFITRRQDLQSLSQLQRRRIAVLSGSSTIASVRYLLPLADLVAVESYQAAWALLEAGETDAFAGDVTVLTGWVQIYPEYRILPSLLSADPLAVALPKGAQYDDLRRLIDTSLVQWHEDGWLEERATFWGLP